MRAVDRLEGLALVGSASLGPLRLPTPGLLESRRPGEPGPGTALLGGGEGSGRRKLRLTRDGLSFDLDFPVLTPEVTGAGPGVYPIAERALLVHAPVPAATLEEARAGRPELVVLGNARALWADGEPFVTALRDLRTVLGAGPVVWAPRVALPHRLAFLAYVGVDLGDTTEGRIAAARGEYLDARFGTVDPAAFRAEGACGCAACTSGETVDRDVHAIATYRQAIAETRAAARAGRLRELVESRTTAEPVLGEMLRHADRELGALLEERTPVVSDVSRGYVLAESHRRPEMVRFRARLLERYRPPPSKEVLLLVPCSKTKPYRMSRSHRRFATALAELRALERVHVVSVSSPVGLVPRELEDVPPARHYDIPVTGDWSEPERAAVTDALDHLLTTGRYRRAVVHLDPKEYAFLAGHFPPELPVEWTIPDGRTTSPEALRALRSTVSRALDDLRPAAGGPLAVVREELAELAAFQFGRPAAEALFAGAVRLAGRPWFQRLTDGRGDLATVREERGLFHLTVAGARRFAPTFPLAVEVDPTLTLEGDLFVPGVRSADPAIREGDSVVLVRGGRLAGVGEAALPGRLMRELERGLAVRVRHREHTPTDTPMTEGASPEDRGPVVQR
jgi:archaeosine synthase alpha-subunit